MAQQDPNEVRRKEEFEYHLRAARIHRTRGDYAAAQSEIDRALQIRPDDAEAREFAADILFARGEWEQAAQAYKEIYEQDHSRTSAEEKYARVTVQLAEGTRQRELLKEMLEHPSRFRLPARSPLVAAILSGIPGLGHVYVGQFIKGVALFLAATICWLLFYALAPSLSDTVYLADRIRESWTTSYRITYFAKNLSAPAVLFLCLAVFTHVYAFVDAAVLAGKTREQSSPASLAEP